jgi:hypothetical protein
MFLGKVCRVVYNPITSLAAFCFVLFFEIRSGYIAVACLQLKLLLPLSPECWDYGYVLPHLA